MSEEFLRSWKVSLVIADSKETVQHRMFLSVRKSELRGLVVTGTLEATDFHLSPGKHKLAIIFEGPKSVRFAAETGFALE